MIVKMSDPVLVDGEVTTLAALADAGRLIFREVEVTCRKRLGERRTRIAYFADLLDTGEGWEIGRLAYLSRTKQPTGRLARRSSAAARTVAEALEVVRAKSARWASTFDPVDGTVLCRRREYARRADGTIVGLSLGRAVARTVEVRRPVVEVAAELQAQAAAAARRVADLAVARAEQAARWRAQAASLRLQADAAEAELPGLEHLPIAVRAAAASQVALLRAEAAELERLAGAAS